MKLSMIELEAFVQGMIEDREPLVAEKMVRKPWRLLRLQLNRLKLVGL